MHMVSTITHIFILIIFWVSTIMRSLQKTIRGILYIKYVEKFVSFNSLYICSFFFFL